MSTTWPIALKHVLKYEGGFVNHPQDPGGATNLGITDRRDGKVDGMVDVDGNGSGDVAIRNLTAEQAGEIYRREYWAPSGCDDLPAGFDVCVFDAAVNCGVRRARGWKLLVEASMTKLNVEQMICEYMAARRAYYRTRPHFPTFGKGWFNRCDQVERLCLSLAKEAQSNGN